MPKSFGLTTEQILANISIELALHNHSVGALLSINGHGTNV